MIQLVYSPEWFFGHDIIIDIFSIIVLLLIGAFSIKYFKIDKNKISYLWLAISFIIIALSFFFKIASNFRVYYDILTTEKLGLMAFTVHSLTSANLVPYLGFLLYRVFALIGLYILYEIYQKEHDISKIVLMISLILINIYFSRSAYYIFHLISLIILIFITRNYYENYNKVKKKPAKMLTYGFAVITLSQFLFIFTNTDSLFYVIAELIQLLGYMILLYTFMMVLKHAKKKKQNRHN